MNPTLFDEIGGKNMVEKASHFLYVKMLTDHRIKHFFEDVDIDKQKRKMTAFLTFIFGGPSLYTGKDMRKAHKNAVANGLNDDHFDAMVDCIREVLTDLNINNTNINKVTKIIETHRGDVLNKKIPDK